jgi:hypothetical protein
MANINIGTQGVMGIVSSRPMSDALQPHWKTATTTP